jgi:alkylation response protein AidB-like acyl-CoA dehydrogenase
VDFSLTEEQELLQETLRSFVARECPPQQVRKIFDGERQGTAALWKGLAEMGIAGLAPSAIALSPQSWAREDDKRMYRV